MKRKPKAYTPAGTDGLDSRHAPPHTGQPGGLGHVAGQLQTVTSEQPFLQSPQVWPWGLQRGPLTAHRDAVTPCGGMAHMNLCLGLTALLRPKDSPVESEPFAASTEQAAQGR